MKGVLHLNESLANLLKSAFDSAGSRSSEAVQTAEGLKPGERRDAAVLFLDLAGFTKLSGGLDHETVHELARSIMNELVLTAQDYRGYVDKIEGDRIMVLFGAVSSGENDSRTAVLCGFRMLDVLRVAREVLKESGMELGARIGISSGPLTVAPDAIGHLTAMGNTVNIASRMEELAELDSILVTDRVHRMCGGCALWSPPLELDVKGMGEPVIAWRALKPLRASCESCDDDPFTGRRMESGRLCGFLEEVEKEWRESTDGNRPRHGLIEITGEAGTGKARLAMEFAKESCPGRLLLRGRSAEEDQPAHWLWSTLVASALGFRVRSSVDGDSFIKAVSRFFPPEEIGDSLPFLGRLIPAEFDDSRFSSLDGRGIALETGMAIRDFMEALGKRNELVVFLEDTHWMDPTDAEALEFVLRNTRTPGPVLFILAGRDTGPGSAAAPFRSDSPYYMYRTVELGDFSQEESREMAAALAERLTGEDHPFSDHAAEFLHRQSSGNPFFLRELVTHMVETGNLTEGQGVWRIKTISIADSAPETLTGILQSRLDNLPEQMRKTILLCGVLGMEFLHRTYTEVCSRLAIPPASDPVFQGLVEKGMLIRADSDKGKMRGYRFRHPLIQKTACGSNLSHNLKLIHRAAAESIQELFRNDQGRISARLAAHWEGAGETARASEWGLAAQKYASENYQHPTVLYWGEKLLQWLPEELEDRLKVLERNSRAYLFTGRRDEQLAALREMERIAADRNLPFWTAKAQIDLGFHLRSTGDISGAKTLLEKALELCRDNGLEDLESSTLGNLGVLAADTGSVEEAREYFTSAGKIHARLGNRRAEASTLGNLGIILRNARDYRGAGEKFQGALEIFQELGDIRSEAITLGNLGNIHHDLGELDQALDLYEKTLEMFTRIGDRRSMGVFLGNLGILQADMGNREKAEDYYQRALAISRETGNLRSRGWTLSNMASMKMKDESPEEAAELYKEALDLFRQVKDRRMEAITLAALGYSTFLAGNAEESLEALKGSVALASELKLPRGDFEGTLIPHHSRLNEEHTQLQVPELPEHWRGST